MPGFHLRHRGITLIELVIVMVILSVLMLFAVPSMRGVHERNKLVVSARKIASLVRFARGEAITGEREVEIRFDKEGGRFRLDLMKLPDEVTGSADLKNRKREEVEQIHHLPQYIYFENIETDDNPYGRDKISTVVFYPDGSATGALITLVNRRPDRKNKDTYLAVQINHATALPEVYIPEDLKGSTGTQDSGTEEGEEEEQFYYFSN